MIEEGQQAIRAGTEVSAARELVRTGERIVRLGEDGCARERKTSSLERSMCANTPTEIAEGLVLEPTRENYEYAGVYEAVCGKRVPEP